MPNSTKTIQNPYPMENKAASQKATKFTPIPMESIKKMPFPEKHSQPTQSSSISPLRLSARIPSSMTSKAKFGLGLSLNSPIKSSKKSVHAYRQRRRELSYRFMKEVGMSVSIFYINLLYFHNTSIS